VKGIDRMGNFLKLFGYEVFPDRGGLMVLVHAGQPRKGERPPRLVGRLKMICRAEGRYGTGGIGQEKSPS